jgi:hypothetical protein
VTDPYEFTLDELLASIGEIELPPPQDRYLTTAEWGRVWGTGLKATRNAIAKLLEAGKMDRSYRVEASRLSDQTYRKPVFGLKENE